jgi:hypothetical protein
METAADLMVLFNAMYPTTFGIAQPHILKAYCNAPSRAHKAAKYQASKGNEAQGLCLTDMGLLPLQLQEAQRYYERFFTFVFPELSPLLSMLIQLDGRYDMQPCQVQNVAHLLERAVRGAWYLQSPDGRLPPEKDSPLHGVASPASVNSKHVAPRLVDRETPDGLWEKSRGALVGISPGGYRQLLSMLIAASTMEVSVQVYRNLGGLLLRPSAAPDILTREGKARSDKAISPLGVEGDQLAWGSREGKLRNCKRQRSAWKRNLYVIKPLCVTISKPVPAEERMQADESCVEFIRSRVASHSQMGTKTSEELESLNVFTSALS